MNQLGDRELVGLEQLRPPAADPDQEIGDRAGRSDLSLYEWHGWLRLRLK
jgi:hypothetical protein